MIRWYLAAINAEAQAVIWISNLKKSKFGMACQKNDWKISLVHLNCIVHNTKVGI